MIHMEDHMATGSQSSGQSNFKVCTQAQRAVFAERRCEPEDLTGLQGTECTGRCSPAQSFWEGLISSRV